MTENSTKRMLGVQAGTGETNSHWLERGSLFDAVPRFPPFTFVLISQVLPDGSHP